MLTRLALILALMLHPAAIAAGGNCRAPARDQHESCCCGDFCLEVTSAAAEVCGCAEPSEPGSQPEAPPPPPELRIDLASSPAALIVHLTPDARTLAVFAIASRPAAPAVPINILHCTWRK